MSWIDISWRLGPGIVRADEHKVSWPVHQLKDKDTQSHGSLGHMEIMDSPSAGCLQERAAHRDLRDLNGYLGVWVLPPEFHAVSVGTGPVPNPGPYRGSCSSRACLQDTIRSAPRGAGRWRWR